MEISILVATHKRAEMPKDDAYLPIHVGHALSDGGLGIQADDDGPNISSLNRTYCELTAVYWAWQNLDADIYGLTHYRRYFAGSAPGPLGRRIMSAPEAQDLMARYDLVVARRRRYIVETVESHYRNAHHGSDLDLLVEAVEHLAPDYVPALDTVLRGRSLSLYNMFVMRRETFDAYSTWLFPILERVAHTIDQEDRTVFQQRSIGYLAERLLNVWVAAHPELRVRHHRVVHVEGEARIKKMVQMLRRKYGSNPVEKRQS
ncbi:putative capsular biosynthesis protein [metagenome]|uniref:Putative capsular biosynthesis protein n=1 Tax=metagenome TaxID=256318 RepID=A0A2P2C6L8_9ZZZZ